MYVHTTCLNLSAYRTNGDSFMYVHTTCLNLSEALSGHYPFICPPRLRSLRSFSLGLLRVCLSEALDVIPHLLIWMRLLHGNLCHPM